MRIKGFKVKSNLININRLQTFLSAFYAKCIQADLSAGWELEFTDNFKKWHKITITKASGGGYNVVFSDIYAREGFLGVIGFDSSIIK